MGYLTRTAVPKSHAEAAQTLGQGTRRKLSVNGILACDPVYKDAFVLFLFGTRIATYHRDGRIVLTHGGHRTMSTVRWMNLALRGTSYKVSRDRKGRMVVRYLPEHGPTLTIAFDSNGFTVQAPDTNEGNGHAQSSQLPA